MSTIDVHAHMIDPKVSAVGRADTGFWQDPFHAYASSETNSFQVDHFHEVYEKLTEPEVRLQDMDEMGIDVQAVAIAPPHYFYATDPSLGEEIAAAQNERIAEVCSVAADRLLGIATVPLQDVERAVRELRRSVNGFGFRAVEISTNVNEVDLDSRRFDPFWEEAVNLDVGVILHPNGFTDGKRLHDYYLVNTIGNPLDTTVAVHRMIYGGVMERHPGLRVCLVHGGGFTPFYFSRMDHAFNVRPECREYISELPSTYLRQFYFDCLVYDSLHLGHLIEVMGIDRVVIGTDYPFDMGYYDPLDQIGQLQLDEEDVNRIHGDNARRFLGLDKL